MRFQCEKGRKRMVRWWFQHPELEKKNIDSSISMNSCKWSWCHLTIEIEMMLVRFALSFPSRLLNHSSGIKIGEFTFVDCVMIGSRWKQQVMLLGGRWFYSFLNVDRLRAISGMLLLAMLVVWSFCLMSSTRIWCLNFSFSPSMLHSA